MRRAKRKKKTKRTQSKRVEEDGKRNRVNAHALCTRALALAHMSDVRIKYVMSTKWNTIAPLERRTKKKQQQQRQQHTNADLLCEQYRPWRIWYKFVAQFLCVFSFLANAIYAHKLWLPFAYASAEEQARAREGEKNMSTDILNILLSISC